MKRYPVSASVFAICVGTLMIAMSTFFIVSGQVPEFTERPAEILLHLAAEFGTAVALLVGGIATVRRALWGLALLLFSLGMLAYTVIVSPGYYVQQGNTPLVVMFALLLLLTVFFLVISLRSFLRLCTETDPAPRRS